RRAAPRLSSGGRGSRCRRCSETRWSCPCLAPRHPWLHPTARRKACLAVGNPEKSARWPPAIRRAAALAPRLPAGRRASMPFGPAIAVVEVDPAGGALTPRHVGVVDLVAGDPLAHGPPPPLAGRLVGFEDRLDVEPAQPADPTEPRFHMIGKRTSHHLVPA